MVRGILLALLLVNSACPSLVNADYDTQLLPTEWVDVVELNHFYDGQGKLVFEQVIFWNWCPRNCEHHVVAWRWYHNIQAIYPKSVVWWDHGILRHVRFHSFLETWTQFDPEIANRTIRPIEKRRGFCASSVHK